MSARPWAAPVSCLWVIPVGAFGARPLGWPARPCRLACLLLPATGYCGPPPLSRCAGLPGSPASLCLLPPLK
jgi:hypothetical protein